MKRLFEALADLESDQFPPKDNPPTKLTHVKIPLDLHVGATSAEAAANDASPLLLFRQPSTADMPAPALVPPTPCHQEEKHLLSLDLAPVDKCLSELVNSRPNQETETQVGSDWIGLPEDAQSEITQLGALNTRSEPTTPSKESVVTNVSQSQLAKPAPMHPVSIRVLPESRLVALAAPNSLGAEKFRALVTRLEHMHKRSGLKCFQVTSSIISEGKTLISANVALSLAKHLGANTLLVEGDLHRPTLGTIMGLSKMRGISHWWSSQDQDLELFVRKVNDLPLSFLPAGTPSISASDILRSTRFVRAFEQLASQFDWVVVDSTPILPIVDVNLWSRLVQGTLLVIREGVTPVKALKQGLLGLDHPNLIGLVLNEASATNEAKYNHLYYGSSNC
ncbi:MAG TPA: CpsD/CapB family tyrosine-protein kinase [Candidatus Acidoferrales bacterium]